MKVIYHNDADGKCSAAIIRQMLDNPFDSFKRSDFISYDYGRLNSDDIDDSETVYIVDISLNEYMSRYISELVDKGCKVVHIDHHKSTLDYLSNYSLNESDKLTTFYKSEMTYDDGQEPMRVSASVLTWVYCCMNDEERTNPNNVKFDFTERFTHVALNIDTPVVKEYMIPACIRFINDWDTWTKALPETDYFHYGFESFTDEETHPFETFWDNHITLNEFMQTTMIGVHVQRYVNATNERCLKNSFECDVLGHKALCLNSNIHSSMVFGDKINEYDLVIVFHYDGSINKWRVSFYSSATRESSVDCSEIASHLGGGGHHGAAGASIDAEFLIK